MSDSLIEELFLAVESEQRTRRTTDFSKVYSKLLRTPSGFRWSKFSNDFVSYSKLNYRPIFIAIYGPEEPQLDIGLCFSNEDYQTFRGREIDDLYTKISSILSISQEPDSSDFRRT